MRHFPIFLDLAGRRALVLGSGEIAAVKAAALRRAGAEVALHARFAPALLDGCALAVGADADLPELEALAAAARARGIPVNVVDRPALCSFIMPALVDRDPVTIAISTGGAAPVLARLLRARIEALVPPGYARLASLAGALQGRIRAALPDLSARRQVLERVFTGEVAELAFAGEMEAAAAAFERAIDGAAPARGTVFLVGAGPGEADLMTLRGQRALGDADVVLYDWEVPEPLVDLARRDAERRPVGGPDPRALAPEALPAHLAALVGRAARVVRLLPGDGLSARAEAEAAALLAAGLPPVRVPGVAGP